MSHAIHIQISDKPLTSHGMHIQVSSHKTQPGDANLSRDAQRYRYPSRSTIQTEYSGKLYPVDGGSINLSDMYT